MTSIFKTEALAEQSTTSSTFINVPSSSLVFTPNATSDIWVILVSGILRSSSTSEVAAEMQLLINGTATDLWGHQNQKATPPNGAGFLIFERITGTVSTQTIQLQYRSASGTTYVESLRIVAFRVPTGANFQFAESDSITSTTGAAVTVLTHAFTPPLAGNYLLFYKISHHEGPSNSTSQAWIEDVGSSTGQDFHPDAPAGTRYSNARDPWSPLSGVFRTNLSADLQTFNLKFTSSSSGGQDSEHRYRRLMLFREDVFDAVSYSASFGESTTTSATFQLKNSVTVPPPPQAREFVSIQSARISGSSSNSSRKVGELRRAGTALSRTDLCINRDSSATQGYHFIVGAVDARTTSASVTFDNGFLSPEGITVNCAESTIVVLRYPPTGEGNASLLGMVA
jgi:hypothetical protein